MERLKQKLLIEQLDKKIDLFKAVKGFQPPNEGWIRAMRNAFRMSLRQLGERLFVSIQSVREAEQREIDGSITIKRMKEVAKALDMQFVYGFIPKEGSISQMIEKQAYKKAKTIVLRTSKSMSLEDQKVDNARIQKAIKERAEELIFKQPRYLWD